MAFLSLVVAIALGPTPPSSPVAYQCLDSGFTLIASPSLAIVRFPDRDYRLPRRSSALAVKYASESATLYLDGDFAAFVADDRPLPGCIRVGSKEEPKP